MSAAFAQTQPGTTTQKPQWNNTDNNYPQRIDNAMVPSTVNQVFTSAVTNPGDVTWYGYGKDYMVSYTTNGKEMHVIYDSRGTKKSWETEVDATTLPTNAKDYFKSIFPDNQYGKVYQVTTADGKNYYIGMMNADRIWFDEKGNYINQYR